MIRKYIKMIKSNLIIASLLVLIAFPAEAQVKKQEPGLKREITLYNPYKPSLSVVNKRSFLPDMTDTVKVKPEFHYVISAKPFQPEYTISQIKPAALLPDPLPKLYKSYVSIGLGNYLTPLAEISISNERSKKGAIGFYGRHLSSSGNVGLENAKQAFAGYMDNDASVYGKRIFRKATFESSVDFTQKVRYAYGYDPLILDYSPDKKSIKLPYSNIGAKASLYSLSMDSTDLYYNFDLYYNYFHLSQNMFQHNAGFKGIMAGSINGLYVGSGLGVEYYKNADSIRLNPEYIVSVSPFIQKGSAAWNFKLGFEALVDRSSILHFYPDINFGFTIVPAYLGFFASLTGKLERNDPLKIVSENPYLVTDQYPGFVSPGVLFRLPDTDHKFVVTTGLKGNNGIGGNYLVSVNYSIIDDMLFYTNIVFPDSVSPRAMGNYFLPIRDAVELLNIHAEMNGRINDKLSFDWKANIYQYHTGIEFPWNKPGWDGLLGLKYDLREKIIAGLELTAIGKRKEVVNGDLLSRQAGYSSFIVDMPAHFNLNLTAEYRYSKILSFWTRLNNISVDRYYEWAYYPSQRFIFMLGFTYSL